MHRAASWGHPDCLRVLVTNGADLQIRNVHGERAREAAARYKKDTCVDYLDRAGTYYRDISSFKLCYKLCMFSASRNLLMLFYGSETNFITCYVRSKKVATLNFLWFIFRGTTGPFISYNCN